MVLTRLGNRQVTATMNIFDEMPNPNQTIIKRRDRDLGHRLQAHDVGIDDAVQQRDLHHGDAEQNPQAEPMTKPTEDFR